MNFFRAFYSFYNYFQETLNKQTGLFTETDAGPTRIY